MQTTHSELLNEEQAAEVLTVTPKALQAWRSRGGGPRFFKVGRLVRYTQAHLEEFLASRVRTSTSDHGPASKHSGRELAGA